MTLWQGVVSYPNSKISLLLLNLVLLLHTDVRMSKFCHWQGIIIFSTCQMSISILIGQSIMTI